MVGGALETPPQPLPHLAPLHVLSLELYSSLPPPPFPPAQVLGQPEMYSTDPISNNPLIDTNWNDFSRRRPSASRWRPTRVRSAIPDTQ